MVEINFLCVHKKLRYVGHTFNFVTDGDIKKVNDLNVTV